MDWLEPDHLQAAVACLLACAVLGWFVPTLIGRIPEPVPDPTAAPNEESDVAEAVPATGRRLFDRSLPPAPDKVLYAAIAAEPHLAAWSVAWSALFGAAIGASVGWSGALLYLVPLVPIGVALMVIDWRTTLLPNRIIF